MPTGFLYRWEDRNHGLEHKCGTCATVLSSPRAKKTCFGIHEEVCTRYHKTLFYVGQSHHCDACHKSIELHDKRHREIAALMQEMKSLDTSTSPIFNKKRKGKKWDDTEPLDLDLDLDSQEAGEELHVHWDSNSSTLNEEETEERKQLWNADARKSAKTERRAAKNQTRFNVITKDDLDNIQNALHPVPEVEYDQARQVQNGQGLADNTTIDQNITFNPHCFKWGSLRQGVHEKKIRKNNGSPRNIDADNPEQVEEISTTILKTLGIKTNLMKTSKERKTLDTKLRVAIMNDLVAFENEVAETMQRMAGYWRYVNRHTYNHMVKNNELWDWATGQKLPEVEEESELEAIQEEDESAEEGTLDRSSPAATPLTSPEACWDNDFELPANDFPLFGRVAVNADEEGFKTPTQSTFANNIELHQGTRSRSDKIQISRLTFSPGRSPGPTLRFTVPSPSSSDGSFKREWDDLESLVEEDLDTAETSPKARVALSPIAPNRKAPVYDGVKDTRTFSKAIFVREASPPSETPLHKSRPFFRNAPSPTTIPPKCNEINNRFEDLDHELPAPCDESKKPGTPSKVKVLNLAMPPKKVTAHAEEGWEIKGAPKKNRKVYPVLGKKTAKKLGPKAAAASATAGGSTWATVVARGQKKRP